MSKVKITKFFREEETSGNEISKIYSPPSTNLLNSFECYFCKKMYINNKDLQKHILDHHTKDISISNDNNSKFVCQQCNNEYIDFNLFADHMKNHINNLDDEKNKTSTSTSQQSCPICKQIFNTKKLLELHILDHFLTTSSSFVCPLCPDEIFYNDNSYRQHYIKNHSETLYRCSHCLQFFTQYNLFQDHMLIHRREIIQYNCIICSVTFSNLEIFTNHIKLIHDNGNRILPMMVPLINQDTSILSLSLDDEDIKTSMSLFLPKNLKCSVCDIECASQYSLDSHRLQVHCKIGKSNKCGICHMILGGKKKFIQHSLEHKVEKSQISCCVCRQSVKSQWQLAMHAEFHLNYPPPVGSFVFKDNKSFLEEIGMGNFEDKKEMVKNDFNNENDLSIPSPTGVIGNSGGDQERRRLIEINEFTCSVCLKQFASLNGLQGHSHIHRNSRSHRCHLCKMAFSTKGRLELHKKKHYCNKEIKCQICDVKFNKLDLLQEHMKTHESNLKSIS